MGSLVDCGEHRLWVEGARDSEHGIPIVLLHPSITDLTIWDRVVEDLPGPVLRYDRPGHGRSPTPTSSTRPVDDLIGLLDALDVERAHLGGNSMGGGTAMAAAMLAPERVATLTVLGPAVPGIPWSDDWLTPEEIEAGAEYERLDRARDLDGLAELDLRIFAALGADEYLRSQVRAAIAFQYSGSPQPAADPSIWEWIPGIPIPLTIVLGEFDENVTNVCGRALADHVPSARMITLASDHLPQYRCPAETAGAVLRTIGRAMEGGGT